jgi:hypothetical protein
LTAGVSFRDSRRMDREFVGVYRLDSADFPLLADYDPDERLARAVATVQALVNDPNALMERAQRLKDGTAERIEGLI